MKKCLISYALKHIIIHMHMTQALIKSLRDQGLSQSEIARQTGIPQPRISRWQKGEVPVGADDALKLAELVRKSAIKTKRAKPISQEVNHA